LLTRPAPRRVPTASAAVFLFAGALAMMWYAQPLLPADDLIRAAVTVQFALLLAPCLLLAWWLRVHPVHTFRLRLPHPSALLLALPVGLTVPIANSALQRALFDDTIEPGAFKELGERFEEAISSNSPLLLVLVLAVLPAVVEELFFRGFVLSALRGAFRGRAALARALFVTALLFALFHIYPEKWLATGTVGLILAVIAVRTGSIWPCMLVHALNNGSLVLYARMQRDWTFAAPVYEHTDPDHSLAVVAACTVLAVSLGALILACRDSAERLPADTPRPVPGAAVDTADDDANDAANDAESRHA
jgi:sodium transport system permease protein